MLFRGVLHKTSVLVLALAVLTSLASIASAQRRERRPAEPAPDAEPIVEPAPAPEPTPEATQPQAEAPSNDEYRAAVTLALVEFQAGRFAEARVLFLRAHGIEPNARTLRGIGMCAFELLDYVGAINALTASLAHESRPLDPQQRTQVEQLLRQANDFVGRVSLVVEPLEAEITVDGLAPTIGDGAVLLNPGDHEIHVQVTGFVPAIRRVHVTGGEPVRLEIRLQRPTVSAPVVPERVRPHPVRLQSALAYGVGGVGVALVAGFGARTIILDRDHPAGCLARGECSEASLDRQDRSALIADIGIGVAVAGTTAGLLMQLLHTEPGSERTPTVTAVVDRTTSMLVVGGAF